MRTLTIPFVFILVIFSCSFAPGARVIYENKNEGFRVSFPVKPTEKLGYAQ